MRPPPPLTRLLAASLSLALAACATVEQDKRAVALYKATTGYQSALRWGYFDNALGHLHPDLRKDQTLPEHLEGLRLVGYEALQSPVVAASGDSALQVVAVEYLYEDRQVVKRLTDRQVWQWDPEQSTWWLMSGLPRFE